MAEGLTIPNKQGMVRDTNPFPVKVGDGTNYVDIIDQNDTGTLPVVLIDSNGDQVSPATEAKQDDIITAIDSVVVAVSPPTDIEGGGKIAVGTTAVEVDFTGTTKSIIVTADKDNTGTLYVGESDIAIDGSNAITFLDAGDEITIDYNDGTNAVYVIASVVSQNFWKGALI